MTNPTYCHVVLDNLRGVAGAMRYPCWVRWMRVAPIVVAGLSLGACSLVTSLNGLEVAGDEAGNIGGLPVLDGALTDDTQIAADADTPDDSTAPQQADGGAPGDSAPRPPTQPDSPNDAASTADSGFAIDSTLPTAGEAGRPQDSESTTDSSDACAADVAADPLNCGLCGHYCQGGECNSGLCGPVTLAVTSGSVGIAIDSTFVYWADSDAGTINKVSKSLTRQGTPTPVVSGPAAQNVQGIASDGMFVYWTNKTASGQVRRALPTGAALTTIATNQAEPDWIASNGTTVVWTDQTGNQIMSAPANSDGGVPAVQLNVSGENGTTPAGIAIDSASAYYASKTAGGGLAESVPLAGGPVSEIGTGTFVGIAIDSTYVYWTGGSANPSVYENIKAGTVATEKTIAAGALTCPLAVVSDGVSVYFLDQGTAACGPPGNTKGALYRVPIGNEGPLPPPLVSGLDDPQGIAVDDTAVYWVTGGPAGSVTKLAK
jgi:hypothetical protein